MSVLINSMDIPKSCSDCPLNHDEMSCTVTETRWRSDTMILLGFDYTKERLHDCPLSEVPSAQPEPCEDAVSRKELLKFFSNNGEGSWTYDTVAIGYIKALPSVQPILCEDAVSRREAIDAIGEVHPLDYNAQAIKSRIEKLPPVQPKRKSMICGECLHCDSETLYVTNPPKIQCRKTGNLHFTNDTCECGADMRGEQG